MGSGEGGGRKEVGEEGGRGRRGEEGGEIHVDPHRSSGCDQRSWLLISENTRLHKS